MNAFHTTKVQNTEILAVAHEDNGYNTVKLTKEQAQALGRKRAGQVFGRTARHQVVRDGQLAEFVTVLVLGRDSIIL